jgi:hypothetical protein
MNNGIVPSARSRFFVSAGVVNDVGLPASDKFTNQLMVGESPRGDRQHRVGSRFVSRLLETDWSPGATRRGAQHIEETVQPILEMQNGTPACNAGALLPEPREQSTMNFAVAVTTAPRPIPTLDRTLASLERAGFDEVRVVDDVLHDGAWSNWLFALRTLLAERPAADALLVCQDDIVCCRRLRTYLERTLWPGHPAALCSPYCPAPYRRSRQGWHQERRGWYLVGALCWAMPRPAAEAILRDLGRVEARSRIDARVGQWARRAGRSVWYHTPSLVQHIGNGNSALGDTLENNLRRAADFVGENVSMDEIRLPNARSLTPSPEPQP